MTSLALSERAGRSALGAQPNDFWIGECSTPEWLYLRDSYLLQHTLNEVYCFCSSVNAAHPENADRKK